MEMLWRRGPLTLSEAQAGLGRAIGYTTIQTRLNRLVEKNVVARNSERPASYSAAVNQADISARHLDMLVERTSGGSVVPLVAHLVRDWELSDNDIAELKKLIADAERHSKSKQK
jgi:predicted transcriptional regulator